MTVRVNLYVQDLMLMKICACGLPLPKDGREWYHKFVMNPAAGSSDNRLSKTVIKILYQVIDLI